MESASSNGAQRPVVSVLAPVRNDRAGLGELLEALDRQTLPADRFEIVIGDDGSDEGFFEGIRSKASLIIASGPAKNPYAALNRARRAARGEVLALCDSDSVPEPDWLERALEVTRESGLVAGNIRPFLPQRPTLWTIVSIEMVHDQEAIVAVGGALTGNLIVRASVFDAVGGFDEKLPSGGDQDFARRCATVGAPPVFHETVAVRHRTWNSGRFFIRKVWWTQYNHAMRTAPENWLRPPLLSTRWLPFVAMARRRVAAGGTVRLDRRRFDAEGVRVSLLQEVGALFLVYGVLQYVALAAGTKAYVDSWRRRLRERAAVSLPRVSR